MEPNINILDLNRGESLNQVFCSLVTLLVFFLILDLEFAVGAISGQGERVGYSSTLVGDALAPNSSQIIAIKVSDIVSLAIFGLLLMAAALKHELWTVSKAVLSQYMLLVSFIAVALTALLWNSTLYTSSQLMICLVYLAKFAETSLIFVFACAFFRFGGGLKKLLKAMLMAGLIAAAAGIINAFTGIFSQWLIHDRVQFYGILVLLGSMWLSAVLSGHPTRDSYGLGNRSLFVAVIVLGVSILVCGKRTVILGMMASFSYIIFCHLSKRNLNKIIIMVFALSLIGVPFVGEQIERSFGGESLSILEGLSEKNSLRLSESWIASIGISGLDYSFTERLARWLTSTDLFFEKPWIGIGFFGTPYVYGFLPDSTLFQLLVETGLLGTLLLLMFFVRNWFLSKRTPNGLCAGGSGIGFRGALVGLIVMGLTANTVYIFNLLGIFFILAAINHHISKPFRVRHSDSLCERPPLMRHMLGT